MIDIHTDLKELEAYIYTVGYMPMGESSLVVIRNRKSEKNILSILFDSFEKNGKNLMFDFLDKFDVKRYKLDCIVWTHPDLDHSVGFNKIIKDYTSADTVFILPEGMSNLWFAKRIWKNRKFGLKKV